MKPWFYLAGVVLVAGGTLLHGLPTRSESMNTVDVRDDLPVATFGGGCFWCIEAIFERVPGVAAVISGYQGGHLKNPTYEDVCRGDTGHAEVIRIAYDPAIVSYERLLEIFWTAHDPTQLNRQGADVGTQYRSVIFYHSDEQKALAEASKTALDQAGTWSRPVVTEITEAGEFYPAEKYHQDYFRRNPSAPYSVMVIRDKLGTLQRKGVLDP